jgi:amino acid adenylation domain-containing protein
MQSQLEEAQLELAGYRLSGPQLRVWQLVHANSDPDVYRTHGVVLLEGELDQRRLRAALEEVVRRHEILRTVFQQMPGMAEPLQVIRDEVALSYREGEEQRNHFDLATGPLMEVRLVRESARRHHLLINVPALCCDARSMRTLVEQLSKCYERPGELDEVLQYADFSEWQNELLQDELATRGREYWRRQHLEEPFAQWLQLFQEGSSFAPRVMRAVLNADPGRNQLLACWAALLSRLHKSSSFVVGVAHDTEEFEELEGALGLFTKWLPVRCQVNSDSRFNDLLGGIDEFVEQSGEWKEYFDITQIAEALGVEPEKIYLPWSFEYHEQKQTPVADGVRFTMQQEYSCSERFALKLSCEARESELVLEFHYDPRVYAEGMTAHMAERFTTLLRGDHDARIRDLSLLGETERRQLLEEWNNTQRDYEIGPNVAEVFATQAALNADAVAIVCGDEQVSYAELNERANQLGRYLRTLGVGPETRVALCVERSVEMVVGWLGILKAGGAYVPLDPSSPQERLRFMLADASVQIVLTQEQHRGLFGNVPIVSLDSEEIQKQSRENFASGVTGENLVYVIYTSGSTGLPKGVLVTQAALLNLHAALRERIYRAEERVAVNAAIVFDGSVKQLVQLLSGATLVLVQEWEHRDVQELKRLVRESEVEVLDCTPSQLQLLLAESMPELKLVLVGGEAIGTALWERLNNDSARYFNVYGPTECTVDAVVSEVQGEVAPVIGRPLGNMQVYVLDDRKELAPVGVNGELYIGGAGLARGYLGRAELTAERFVPHPYSSEAGARLYRTGDVVRYLADGNIQYVERADQQVKIRGYRIELGEIEAVLSEHANVSQAVVLARGDRLVAYVVPQGESDSSEWREYLQQRLPEYMAPSVFVSLPALPLTTNGKVDRRALPEPETVQREGEIARTPTEELLCGIWSEVLGLTETGVTENFFDLGGHSLLATQVLSRIQSVFQIELPLRTLFEAPTVRELAARVEAVGTSNGVPPLKRVSRDEALPLSFAQQRLWFLAQLEPENPFYNSPLAVRLKGELQLAALELTLQELIRRHEVLRTSFVTEQGKPQQVIGPVVAPLTVIDLSHEAEQEARVREIAAREAAQPFDLSRGPLLRVKLVQLSSDDHVLLFTMHHIVSDGWSMSLLIREVSELYSGYASGREPELPELPIQYADYASWQREWLQGEALAEQVQYWRSQLAGAPPVLELTNKPRPSVQTYRGAHEQFSINTDVVNELKELSRREGVTFFMLLLAAFQLMLMRYSGSEDIVVGTDVAGRRHKEVEGLIGFFINELVLRTDLSGNPTFKELLQRVREVCLGAYSHQDLPFEKLVEELQPERTLSRNPLFQVLFVHQKARRSGLQLDGLTIKPFAREAQEVSKFDLALFILEGERSFGTWDYNTDIFDAETITRMSTHYNTLLSNIAANPDARLNELEMISEEEKQRLLREEEERERTKRNRFKSTKPRLMNLADGELVKLSGETFPLLATPNVASLDLIDWAQANRELLQAELSEHGAILFRGFKHSSVNDFEKFAQTVCAELFGEYGDLPRLGVSGKVYTSTPYPSDQAILFHNESSHMHRWPLKIFFYCVQPAEQGGETPLVDCRRIYRELRAETVERFREKKLMYVRNFTENMDISWQDFFRTTNKAEVEKYCAEAAIECEWYGDNGLRTRQVRQAIVSHPVTGEPLFFNQLQLHHVSYLDPAVRASLLSLFAEDRLPRHVYYGDGSAIEEEVIEEVSQAYENAAVKFPWQAMDILMVDNMLVAHGRSPFVGQRKIVVTMGDMFSSR